VSDSSIIEDSIEDGEYIGAFPGLTPGGLVYYVGY
jgi:hypothetical protein